MEIIKDYKAKMAIARQLRAKIEEAGMNIAMRSNNIRKFKKATNYPFVVCEHRNFHKLGEWYVCITAESRSRFFAGIIGICAFKIEKDTDGNITDILLVEGVGHAAHDHLDGFRRSCAADCRPGVALPL